MCLNLAFIMAAIAGAGDPDYVSLDQCVWLWDILLRLA